MLDIKKLSGTNAAAAGSFLLSAAAGWMLSGSRLAGVASFADISLCGAFGLPLSAAVLSGGLVHSIVTGTVGRNIVKILSMILLMIMKLFLEPKNDPKLNGIGTAVSIFVSGAAVSAVIGEVLYKLLFYVFYGALAGFTAYSVSLISVSLKRMTVIDLSGSCGCAYAVVYTIFMASLCSVRFPVIDPGIVLGVTVTLLAACYYRHTGGVLCGALTACGAFLASPECGMTVVLLPAAGLLTGYLHRLKYTFLSAVFVGLSFMLMILTGLTVNGIETMLNIIIGTGLFIALAPMYSDKLVMTASESISALPEIMSSRMNFMAGSIGTLRKESGKIAELLAENTEGEPVIDEICADVCRHCFRRLVCWKNEHDTTLRVFRRMSQQTEFSKESFPYELDECLHKQELREAFERKTRDAATSRLLDMRFSESRELLFEQIKVMEELIGAAGERTDIRYSEPISKLVRDKLGKFGYRPSGVIACYNAENRLLIELYFPYAGQPDSCVRICDLISDELHLKLSAAEPVCSGKELRIRIYEKPMYTIDVYGASLCADGAGENGDTSAAFSDGTGISYVVLSDGMGSGRSAAIESRMVVRMFRRLISSGVNYSSAVKLINSIMLTKSRNETFATLDAVRIDLDSCRLTVIKSGAAATLIRHRGNVLKISSPTFPIGIYEQSETFSRDYELEAGDIIIMFSDGISESEYLFIKELLLGGDDIKQMVDEICTKAEVFNPTVHSDDVTVIGIRVARSG